MGQRAGRVDAPGDGHRTLVGKLAADHRYRRQVGEPLHEVVVERDSEGGSERIPALKVGAAVQ